MNYILSIMKNHEDENKGDQVFINYYTKIKLIRDWLYNFLNKEFNVPEQDIDDRYCRYNFSLQEFLYYCTGFELDKSYISECSKILESEYKNDLSELIKDKNFLNFVDNSYKSFNNLVIDILRFDFNSQSQIFMKLPSELLSEVQKQFHNNEFKEENLNDIKCLLNLCANEIFQDGITELCDGMKYRIKEYREDHDETKLKNKMKSKVTEMCNRLIPIKNLVIKLLKEFVNNYDKTNLSDKEKESLMKTIEKIQQRCSELDEFVAKYNIQLSEEHNKIEQNNIDDE